MGRLGPIGVFCAAWMFIGTGAAIAESTAPAGLCPAALSAGVPARRAGAPGGAAFAAALSQSSAGARDAAVAAALESGNVPGFLRSLRPVVLGGDRQRPEIVLCVAPDYLAVGSDDDFLRVPMGLPTAIAVATRLGFVLPTRKIVDAVYRQAEVRLAPQPLPPTAEMVSTAYFRHHNAEVETQRRHRGARLGALTAGDKKDIVLTRRLWSHPGKVAIYGWHRLNGRAIQPLSTVHGAGYADYSHGVRLVSAVVTVDGAPRSIYEVLADPALAPLISDEGPMPRIGDLVTTVGGTATGAGMARRLAVSVDRATAGRMRMADR